MCEELRVVVDHTHSFLQSLYALKKSASSIRVGMFRLNKKNGIGPLTGNSLCIAFYLLHSCSSTEYSLRQLPGTDRATRSCVCWRLKGALALDLMWGW